ncbi:MULTISPECIES: H-NS family nucleoid-associated regulatory protein [Pseudomonas]|uniref:H-NS family nucleoid-associated regulatory protein n=1 Tax=Pseudomonas TaxID=286 RepID=UPI00235F3B11|nr:MULTISPECIES: H-NS family nucleoid-associated regulatory protein [Pseudomonas]WJV25677.1 H-NS family nucleoid-associated regulatory protein [Pseudomonas chlororaphis]
MALTTLKSLDAEIKLLEAQKKLVEKRDGEVPKALAVLQKYAKVLSTAQRRQVAKLIGETIDATPARTARAAVGVRRGRKLGKVAPKYRLPTGETWAGRGLTPKIFATWAKSADGKAWAKTNPGAKFPPAEGTVKDSSKVVKNAGEAPKKTARKAVNRPTKKARKKADQKV